MSRYVGAISLLYCYIFLSIFLNRIVMLLEFYIFTPIFSLQCNRLLKWCPAPDCSNAVKVSHVEAKPSRCRYLLINKTERLSIWEIFLYFKNDYIFRFSSKIGVILSDVATSFVSHVQKVGMILYDVI